MRTVIIGSDFMYNSNGDLIPIEINTGTDMDGVILEPEPFNLSEFEDFVTSNNFTRIEYIGVIKKLSDKLKDWCILNNIEYITHVVPNGGLTIPDVEDSETTLIIRTAYDNSAIIDYEYCRSKINFMGLILEQTFGSQYAYIDENDELVNRITSIPDNGVHPNFIVKSILPQYDKDAFPALYRITNQIELNILLESLNDFLFLMEYHYNGEKLYENHIQLVRCFNLIYPTGSTLSSISIGNYTRFPGQIVPTEPLYDENTHQLLSEYKGAYITDGRIVSVPKLLTTDYAELWDGTFKIATELNVGDDLKSILIPYTGSTLDFTNPTINYHLDYDTFLSGTTYVSNKITHLTRVSKLAKFVVLTFDDNTTWSDTMNSSYLILRDNEIRFAYLEENTPYDIHVEIGDQVVLIDTSDENTVSTVLKTITQIDSTIEFLDGYAIEVEFTHVFLTKETFNTPTSYAAIEHNANTCCITNTCPPTDRCNKSCVCEFNPT